MQTTMEPIKKWTVFKRDNKNEKLVLCKLIGPEDDVQETFSKLMDMVNISVDDWIDLNCKIPEGMFDP